MRTISSGFAISTQKVVTRKVVDAIDLISLQSSKGIAQRLPTLPVIVGSIGMEPSVREGAILDH